MWGIWGKSLGYVQDLEPGLVKYTSEILISSWKFHGGCPSKEIMAAR